MINIISAIVVAVSLLFRPTPEVFDVKKVERAKASVAIYHHTPDPGICTAFSIAPNYFLTAAHCIGEDTYHKLFQYEAEVVSVSLEYDLALLRADLILPPLEVEEDGVQPGEMVFSIGYGLAYNKLVGFHMISLIDTVANLRLLDFYPDPTALFYVTYNNANRGMSGGPILTREGKVVSVVSSGGQDRPGQPLGYVPHTSLLVKFLEGVR